MAGLDNFLVEGEEAVKELIDLVKKIEGNKVKPGEIIKQLQHCVLYSKINHSLHCKATPGFFSVCQNEHDDKKLQL